MNKVTIIRTSTSDEGTFGKLSTQDDTTIFSCVTGELPDRANQDNISSIPAGTYPCVWSRSNRLSAKAGHDVWTYEVTKVPDRAGIRFHSANFCGDKLKDFKSEINGCIALGKAVAKLGDQKAIISSRDSVAAFERYMKKEPFALTITEDYGTE